jgi:putative transposase
MTKGLFSIQYLKSGGEEGTRNISRKKKGEAAVWQRRFWEHMIRDEEDMQRHFDYIHYNPIKHSLVKSVADWKWSTFHKYVGLGFYHENWGCAEIDDDKYEFGE